MLADALHNKRLTGVKATPSIDFVHRNNTAYALGAQHVEGIDPAFAAPVTASPEEVRYAQELRRQLKKKYLDWPSKPWSLWCVGVD